jgi:hypothetical protein
LKVKSTRARPKIEVTADGRGIVSHAGLRLPAEVADGLGLTEALSSAMAPTRQGSQRSHVDMHGINAGVH